MRGRPAALLLAAALDLLGGEPPSRWHPVAWLGRALSWAERRVGGRGISHGAVAVGAVTLAAGGAAAVAQGLGRRLGVAGLVLEALALKPAFAIRRLAEAARGVERALRAGELDTARACLGRDLVSRPTGDLARPEVVSGAVESVAENLVDSVAAPLLAYAVFGLPGAWVYRALNTADAMWGYRDPRHERFGKVAARLDDAANLPVAPLGAALIAAGASLVGERGREAWRAARSQHGLTASPNAGWPMAAMAGALSVGLAKRGAYRLGEGPLPDSPDAVRRAVRVLGAASALGVLLAAGVALGRSRAGVPDPEVPVP